AVPEIHAQRAALLLGERRAGGEQQDRCKYCDGGSWPVMHGRLPVLESCGGVQWALSSCTPPVGRAPMGRASVYGMPERALALTHFADGVPGYRGHIVLSAVRPALHV